MNQYHHFSHSENREFNNMFFVYLIQQGVAVEEMLQAVGPFASTVYAKKE